VTRSSFRSIERQVMLEFAVTLAILVVVVGYARSRVVAVDTATEWAVLSIRCGERRAHRDPFDATNFFCAAAHMWIMSQNRGVSVTKSPLRESARCTSLHGAMTHRFVGPRTEETCSAR
jgi:hypothetical protein